ncbi:MAG: F0F1 ATP synthase subunit epsilon [Syntrophorhabdus aromaticivorans]|uniref:ATP synthase epsilon chain n=2 Tax=Syntrophorhabdus aromaticivorans TaxID=328301 RepID=A0A971M868_9BACT|nr:F0F1 ATP synthase subunit epsilon [Syntrophorhabdus aromaticivorans]
MVSMLNLEIITPEKVLVSEEVDMVEAKGSLGEFGVLPGHIQFLTVLEIGEVRYTKDGKTSYLATSGGFGEVADDKVTFLLDTAEFADDIDLERAKIAMEEAQERLKELEMDTAEYRMYELALLRALARLQVASKKL